MFNPIRNVPSSSKDRSFLASECPSFIATSARFFATSANSVFSLGGVSGSPSSSFLFVVLVVGKLPRGLHLISRCLISLQGFPIGP
jgi:hypothetical protein